MNLFYNEKGIGDTLIMNSRDVEFGKRNYEKFGDIVRIFDTETNETVGYNLFNASSYGQIDAVGAVQVTKEVEQLITNAFTTNNVQDTLDIEPKVSFVVGYVESKEKHPNADKLNVCLVNLGSETVQIVCGASNVDKGQKVVVAKIGAIMPSGLAIKKSSLRGVESSGMICSAKELALPNAPEEKGILVLDESYEIGAAFN